MFAWIYFQLILWLARREASQRVLLFGFAEIWYASKNSETTMTLSIKKSHTEFAKMMAAACVRRGYIEKLHCGTPPVTHIGDYSDVKVIDADGNEIPWDQVSRISQAEMKNLMTGVVNRIHTFLARTLFSASEDKEFNQALDRAAVPWTKAWDEPEYLPHFLMPHSGEQE